MLRVCIVEDNVPLSEAYQEEFARHENRYACFEPLVEGESATDVASAIAELAPDYLIIDARLNLKNGTINDGIEILRCLREYHQRCEPIVLLVTNTVDEVRKAYEDFNCVAYLPKHADNRLTANVVAQFVGLGMKPPSSPEHFFLEPIQIRDGGRKANGKQNSAGSSQDELIDIEAQTLTKRINGHWHHIPIPDQRAARLLNELMSQPGSWISLESLKEPVAPGGRWNIKALTAAASEIRRSFEMYFEPLMRQPSPVGEQMAQVLEDLKERLRTDSQRGAIWMPPS